MKRYKDKIDNNKKGDNMGNKLLDKLKAVAISVSILSGLAMAESQNNQSKISMAASDTIKLIDLAGRQRMLSQRIAKDYLYIGKNIAIEKANKEMKKSLDELTKSHKILLESINDPDIKNLLAFVKMSSEDFKDTARKKYNLDNAQIALDLSESMLEGSQYIVDSLKKKSNIEESGLVAKAGRQRMLAQRIAKYYIAYQAGIKDKNTVDQMKRAVKDFGDVQDLLMQNPSNTPEINRKLNKINRLWKIVYKFYLNIEKGGLPLIVFNTTDTITNEMNTVTNMYVKLYQK